MVQFGRRLHPPTPAYEAVAAPLVEPEADWTLSPLRRRVRPQRRVWLSLIGLGLVLGISDYWHFEPGAVRDRQAAVQLQIPGFAVPPGCPARRWADGEYMPRACATGSGHIARPSDYGLPVTESSGRHRRTLHWVEAGPDAVIVRCAPLSCRVVWGVRNLFRFRPGGIDGVYDPDVRDYRAKPLDYMLTEASGLLVAASLVVAGLVLLLRRVLD